MIFAFSAWNAFWLMGGYAFYVWTAVVFTLVALMILVIQTLWQQQALRRDLAQQQPARQILIPPNEEDAQ